MNAMGQIDVHFWIGLVIGIIWIFRRKMKKMRREMQEQIDEMRERYEKG